MYVYDSLLNKTTTFTWQWYWEEKAKYLLPSLENDVAQFFYDWARMNQFRMLNNDKNR